MHRFTLATLCLCSFAPISSAAVFERDFHTPGDGLLTYDDVNQREWMDLTETLDFTLDELNAALSTNGTLKDFSVATVNDVLSLADSAGVDWIELDLQRIQEWPDGESAGTLIDFVGTIVDHRNSNINCYGDLCTINILEVLGLWAAAGLVVDATPVLAIENSSFKIVAVAAAGGIEVVPGAINPVGNNFYKGGITTDILTISGPISGHFWLYRNVIPEPSSLVFAVASGVIALTIRSRSRH